LALSLNRDISIETKGSDPDWGLRASVGNNFLLDEDWEFGFLVEGSYATRWRKTETTARNFSFPEERFEKESETTKTVDLYGTINFGIRFTDDHEISTTTLFIRNTDDEVAVINFFNENREKSDGIGFRDERIKFEEREMIVNQIKGTHYLGEATRELVPWMPLDWIPETFQVDWYYSNATAKTDIPNEVNVSSETVSDSITGIVSASNVMTDSAAADYRFTNLEDEVINYAGHFTWPISTVSSYIEISGGGEHSQKVRNYEQSQFSLGALRVNNAEVLLGPLGSVFSDSNIIDTTNNFVFDLTGTNNQSYIAVTMTDALFGNVDWTWNDRWRISAGARWEDYKQVALDHNIYAYSLSNPQVSNDPEVLAKSVFTSDEIYPSVSLTYMTDWWAETFQLRFGWSQTVVRPDLREITDASYVDARTGFLTRGDPSVVPSDISNFDLRAEWFFSNGDNLTVGLYAKDIKNPIEFFESAASDTNRSREIINAESGNVYGIEVEGLKALGFLGEFWEAFFVQGNLTLQESELVAGIAADAPTNSVRDLSGASNYVINFLIGFDSFNTRHAATLSYNVFGERLFVAGRRGAPDAFEQPFNSLDLTYSWYPRDGATVKLKLQNILDESVTIKRRDLIVFDEKPGMGVSLSVKWMM